MKKKSFLISLIAILIFLFHYCDDNDQSNSTIKKLENEDALVRVVEETSWWILKFPQGIDVNSENLMDTIYTLNPTNLPDKYKADSLPVIVSGNIKENPPWSSHNNYTDFEITNIEKR